MEQAHLGRSARSEGRGQPDLADGPVAAAGTAVVPGPVANRRSGGLWTSDLARSLAFGAVATTVLRLVTEWIGLVATYGVNFPHKVAQQPSRLVDIWGHWDAGYYQSIAFHGYPGRAVAPGQAAPAVAFGPVYPWCIRLVHAGLGGLASAECVSFLASCVGIALLRRLVTDQDGKATAGSAVTLLLCWPTSFFLVAPYPESTALALAGGALLAASRRRWILAGFLVAFATLTKYYLILLLVPVLAAAWSAAPRSPAGVHTRTEAPWRRHLRALMVWDGSYLKTALPVVAVLALWIGYVWDHTGSPLAFESAQKRYWGRSFAFPWTSVGRAIGNIVSLRVLDTSSASVVQLFDLVTVIALAFVCLALVRRGRRPEAVCLGSIWCLFTFQSYLIAETREVLVLPPFFAVLGALGQRSIWLERLALALFLPCAYFLIVRFVNGQFAG